jgi:succinoglycan biosynthesis protein ExoW
MPQYDFGQRISVAIIVPFFQREPAILRRCLASVFYQTLSPGIEMHVIIVDDASPWPAKDELRDIQIPKHITMEIVIRDNGGPGAARNTGLDHVPSGIDFIAFIDSDDTWREEHIQRAICALGGTNDLYFSDHLQWAGFSYLETKEFGALLGHSSILRPHATVEGVWCCHNTTIISSAVYEFIAHISSIVYRRDTLSTCRFDEELRWAGEDDLFLLNLLFTSTYTCISGETEVELGFGENIFLRSWSWDNENNLGRFLCQIIAQIRIRTRYQLNPELQQVVTRRIRSWRPALVFFIVRQLVKGNAMPRSLLLSLFREDPLFLVTLPLNIVRAAVEWACGSLSGKPAFAGARICR